MCGIATLFAAENIEAESIRRMTDIIAHRGPDGEGHVSLLDGRLWLGHRRLAIIDLTTCGHQPMSYRDGRYWITFNGEIYNYIELREELRAKGLKFLSDSDTEVLLAAYAEWGRDCLHRFNGMWAFVIVDTLKKKLFAARDRFGVKPLYYWKSPQGFWALASEIKQFSVLSGWNARMNGQRVYDFLNWGLTDHTAETLYRDVFQVRAGHAVECPLDGFPAELPLYQWYRLKPQPFSGSWQDAVNEFKRLFFDANKLRLRADVPVGSCLSGGLDSSSIVCAVNELLKDQKVTQLQRTVSSCSEIKKYDECEYIDEVINSRRIQAYYTYPSFAKLVKTAQAITWHQDEPFGSTSIYAQWCVFESARQNSLIVMLDGQGADEQLAGYHGFFGPRFAGLWKRLQWFTLINEIIAAKKIHNYGPLFALVRLTNTLLPGPIREVIRRHYNGCSSRPEWLDYKRLCAVPGNPFEDSGMKTDTIQDMSIAQLTANNLPMLLHWEDRNSMAHSVESRLPFLDYRLVEFVLGLPDEMKLSSGITKKVLRDAMNGILPEKIRNRSDKMGFVTPEEMWIKNNPAFFRDELRKAIDLSDGILTPALIEKYDRMVAGEEKFSFLIWRVINFGYWQDKMTVNLPK